MHQSEHNHRDGVEVYLSHASSLASGSAKKGRSMSRVSPLATTVIRHCNLAGAAHSLLDVEDRGCSGPHITFI